jgi:hypothetical protein
MPNQEIVAMMRQTTRFRGGDMPAHQLSGSQLPARQAESLVIRAKGSRALQRPNINEHSTAGLLATSVASFPSLTVRSTRTSMLRMAAG